MYVYIYTYTHVIYIHIHIDKICIYIYIICYIYIYMFTNLCWLSVGWMSCFCHCPWHELTPALDTVNGFEILYQVIGDKHPISL